MVISWVISPFGKHYLLAAAGVKSANRLCLLPSAHLAMMLMNEEWHNDQVQSLNDCDWVGSKSLFLLILQCATAIELRNVA